MSKGITSSPIEMALEGVTWVPAPDQPQDAHDGPGIPYATHSGVWEFGGHSIRVYRLSNGKAIIDADDFWKVLGITDASDGDSHS